jgi:hypothetical protein
VIRCRTTRTLLPIHPRWIPKYVIHIYYFSLFFTIVIVLSKLLFFQATRCRTTPCCAVGRGGQATSYGTPGGAVDVVQLRRPLIASFMDRWRPETPDVAGSSQAAMATPSPDKLAPRVVRPPEQWTYDRDHTWAGTRAVRGVRGRHI